MFPLDLSGVGFLVFFGSAVALVFLLALASDQLRRPESPLSESELEALGPYQLACLAGGRETVVDAAVVSLVYAGQLSIDAQGRVARRFDAGTRAGPHAYRSLTLELSAIERAVLQVVANRPRSIHAVRNSGRGAAEGIEQELVQRGLLMARLPRALGSVVGTCWLGVVLWFVGIMRVLQGVSDGYAIGFLVLMLLPLTVFVLKRRRRFPEATYRGEAALRHWRSENAALQTTAKTEPAQVEAQELALAYVLFGTTVLTGALSPLAHVLSFGRLDGSPAPGASATSVDSSGGFSCAVVGGGCGSSCSGGCGGCGGGGD